MDVTTDVTAISHLTQTCVLEVLRKKDANVYLTVETSEDVMFELKSSSNLLDSHGFVFRGGYITWSTSAAEQQIKNQYVLQRIKMEHDFASDKERIELDAYIASEQRKAELNARLSLSNVHAEETAAMALEMERLEASGKFDLKFRHFVLVLGVFNRGCTCSLCFQLFKGIVLFPLLEVERQRIMAAPVMEITEKKAQQAMEAEAEQAKQAMAMFEEVQARKRERMAMNKEQERALSSNNNPTRPFPCWRTLRNSTDPQVQLAVETTRRAQENGSPAQKDAYKDIEPSSMN